MSSEAADELLSQALALTDELEATGAPYAVVGGMAVLMQARSAGFSEFRATYDIDIMVDDQRRFSALVSKRNEEAIRLGIVSSADEVLRDGFMEEPSHYELNESMPPLMSDDGRVAIGLDSVISLNGYSIDTLKTEKLDIDGHSVMIATCEQLRSMKEKTISLLGATPLETSRPQDFIDIGILNKIIEKKELRKAREKAEAKRGARGDEKSYVVLRDKGIDRGHKAPKHDR